MWIEVPDVVKNIAARAEETKRQEHAVIVAVTGIDGAGKTRVAKEIESALRTLHLAATTIALDEWHSPPQLRFGSPPSPRHFYEHAYRFEELFSRLIVPLRSTRAARADVELLRLIGNHWFPHTYDFRDIDVVLLEGIFLLKRGLRSHYDLGFWIDCSFETALQRALARKQEGLAVEELISDYETIYFPAQRIHLATDQPRAAAHGWLVNDDAVGKGNRLPAGAETPR